jgi:hypothetical protein
MPLIIAIQSTDGLFHLSGLFRNVLLRAREEYVNTLTTSLLVDIDPINLYELDNLIAHQRARLVQVRFILLPSGDDCRFLSLP